MNPSFEGEYRWLILSSFCEFFVNSLCESSRKFFMNLLGNPLGTLRTSLHKLYKLAWMWSFQKSLKRILFINNLGIGFNEFCLAFPAFTTKNRMTLFWLLVCTSDARGSATKKLMELYWTDCHFKHCFYPSIINCFLFDLNACGDSSVPISNDHIENLLREHTGSNSTYEQLA